MGMKCEVGLRRKTYNVLTGSVLSVWIQVEQVLTHDGNKRGANSKMQVSVISTKRDFSSFSDFRLEYNLCHFPWQ